VVNGIRGPNQINDICFEASSGRPNGLQLPVFLRDNGIFALADMKTSTATAF
jgi:hypothetical protein